RVHAEARSNVPFERLEVVFNGEVVAAARTASRPLRAELDTALRIDESGWLAARCDGPRWEKGTSETGPTYAGQICAHSSPIYIHVVGQPIRRDAALLARL